jgi:lipopolysaccharide assembly outer membrane protein LptD (OstA)
MPRILPDKMLFHKNPVRLVILKFLLLSHLTSFLFAQQMTNNQSQVNDSLKTIPQSSHSGLEGPVKYKAHQISFSIDGRKTYLRGEVKIEYLNMTLDAGNVTIDWDKNLMIATASLDSTDSLGNPIARALPVFSEKDNAPITGKQLEYNFSSQRGRIYEATTKMETGFYRGKEIKKMGQNTLLVQNGYFTTCDSLENPHFYFKSSKMRIMIKKRVIAKPIYLYIADIPVFAIPFGVIPMETGRRSGLIIPTYGNSSYGGNYLRNFGYYWAASEYWDATMLMDFFERTGTAYQGELRYRKRYSFDGNVSGRFAPKDVTTGQKRQRWSLDFRHNQNIGQTATLNASGSFVSDNSFLRDFSHNLQDRLQQVLTTNVTFSKRWPGSKNSLSANINRTENLQNKELDFTLPRLSFSHTQSNLFSYTPAGGKKKKWYHDIYYSYNSNFLSRGQKKFQTDSTYNRSTKTAWQHNANFSYNSKILKYFKYNQSVRAEELWVPEYLEYTFIDSINGVTQDTVKEFKSRHTFSTSIGASTTIYGLFELPFSPLKVIRHKMDPSITFSFSPDFSDPNWGYTQVFTDTSGKKLTPYDRFMGNPFGGTSSSESRRMNISISNLFQGKIIRNGEEKKIDLFNLNFRTSYDFVRDSINWNDISSDLRARASRDFDFTFSATHSLYKTGHSGFGRRNEFIWENGFSLPRLVRIQINTSLNLRPPQKKQETPATVAESEEAEEETIYADQREYDITKDPLTERLREFSLPWDLNLNFTYSLDRSNINAPRKRFDSNVSGRIELTPHWRVQYSANFDILNKEITHQTFNIYRDLHCWEMTFSWSPSPAYSFFNLEIRVKDTLLRDLKLTKSSGSRRPF